MNELSLFIGAGRGVLGSKILGHTIIGYVEKEKYVKKSSSKESPAVFWMPHLFTDGLRLFNLISRNY